MQAEVPKLRPRSDAGEVSYAGFCSTLAKKASVFSTKRSSASR
jgi:hypothetical protein